MTDDRADVIEQVTIALWSALQLDDVDPGGSGYVDPTLGVIDMSNADLSVVARALHDAGLSLADPADRKLLDTLRDWHGPTLVDTVRRAERAEAELAELRATVDRVRALADAYETDATYEVSGERRVETIRRAVGYRQVADSLHAALNAKGDA